MTHLIEKNYKLSLRCDPFPRVALISVSHLRLLVSFLNRPWLSTVTCGRQERISLSFYNSAASLFISLLLQFPPLWAQNLKKKKTNLDWTRPALTGDWFNLIATNQDWLSDLFPLCKSEWRTSLMLLCMRVNNCITFNILYNQTEDRGAFECSYQHFHRNHLIFMAHTMYVMFPGVFIIFSVKLSFSLLHAYFCMILMNVFQSHVISMFLR